MLFAFAEARNYSGDGCIPAGSNHSSDEGIRSLALKTSHDRGRTWGGLEIVDWNGINPAAVYDEVADQVVVHYPYTSASASKGTPTMVASTPSSFCANPPGSAGRRPRSRRTWSGAAACHSGPRLVRLRCRRGPGSGCSSRRDRTGPGCSSLVTPARRT